jgi:hypothetical protein
VQPGTAEANPSEEKIPITDESIVISVPPEEVFDYLNDPTDLPEFDATILTSELEGDGPVRVGSRFRGGLHLPPRRKVKPVLRNPGSLAATPDPPLRQTAKDHEVGDRRSRNAWTMESDRPGRQWLGRLGDIGPVGVQSLSKL